MFAVLNVHKPLNITSHDVISRLRRVYNFKRIGHLGTLDPLAEGVLPVCFGQATRLIEYFGDDKRYRAAVSLGRTTTTLDAAGEEVTRSDCAGSDLSSERLESVLAQFRGVIQQQVPLYSAVHVKGKKLYQLAYEGKTADLPTREAKIYELTLLGVDTTNPAEPVLLLDVHCGSGTYIRSLARDIGEQLGVGAYLSGLVRTQHGTFHLNEAIPLETIQAEADPLGLLQDPLDFLGLPQLPLPNQAAAQHLRHGLKLDPATLDLQEASLATWPTRLKPNAFYMARLGKEPIGVLQAVSGLLKPIKIFPPIVAEPA
jgi:tRNA pseudouridine55 synthase